MNAVTSINFDSFVFAQGEELKTNSLKIAEAFGKQHKNVLASIDKILTQVSDSFGKLNFQPTEYVQNNNLGIPTSYRMYEVTKDGFMIVVMGFTGEKAMQIKEAYINAFNVMHAKLFPKTQYALKDQPKLTRKPEPVMTQKIYDCWMGMVEIFGNQLINEYGTLPPDIWMEAIEELTPEQIKCGFEGVKKSRSPFMPRLPVFLAYCHEEDVVTAKQKDMELFDKKKQIALPCESREDILKHIEFYEIRINAFMDLLVGMKRSNEVVKARLIA